MNTKRVQLESDAVRLREKAITAYVKHGALSNEYSAAYQLYRDAHDALFLHDAIEARDNESL